MNYSSEQIDKNKAEVLALLGEVKREGMDKLIAYISNSDFFNAPSSIKHHLNCYGGLCQHSLNVYRQFEILLKQYGVSFPRESVILCGLLHDLCKVDLYIAVQKPKKVDGKWINVDTWDYSDSFPAGHSEKSIFRIMQFIKLTKDEILAINSHMGAFDSRVENRDFNTVFDQCAPAVLLHVADFISANILEKDTEEQPSFL
ncbi:MAG: metal-dependent phosphohydrolase [Alphaproteobacteria bacterium]|nr:metal-dependent phosphohydrolase [Alphaproteobacteria bacterium]